MNSTTPAPASENLPSDDDILGLFERLAIDAGRVVMRFFEEGVPVEAKADLSPVTEADRAAEKVILDGLRSACPHLHCVAEEETAAGVLPGPLPGEFVLVDPLDGTREFVARNADFTVNIALVRGGAPVIGVVFAPLSRRLYAGKPGLAEFVAVSDDFVAGERRRIAARSCLAPPTIVASRSHMNVETEDFIKGFGAAEIVSVGSSLKFCMIAAAEADVYPRFGRTMEWDTAAGDAVLRAAGGMTETVDGLPLAYGKRNIPGEADFANPAFIARGGRPAV